MPSSLHGPVHTPLLNVSTAALAQSPGSYCRCCCCLQAELTISIVIAHCCGHSGWVPALALIKQHQQPLARAPTPKQALSQSSQCCRCHHHCCCRQCYRICVGDTSSPLASAPIFTISPTGLISPSHCGWKRAPAFQDTNRARFDQTLNCTRS